MYRYAKVFKIALIAAVTVGSLQWMPNTFPHASL